MKLKERELIPDNAAVASIQKKKTDLNNLAKLVQSLVEGYTESMSFSSDVILAGGPFEAQSFTGTENQGSAEVTRFIKSNSKNTEVSQTLRTSTAIPKQYVSYKIRDLYQRSIDNLKSELIELNDQYSMSTEKYRILTVQRSTLNSQLENLYLNIQETRSKVAEKANDVRLVAKAIQPIAPFSPDVMKIIIHTAVFSFLISLILCIFMEFINTVERNSKQSP